MKTNSFLAGILLGILCPVIGITVFYFWKASSNPFSYFLQVVFENKTFLTAVISFALFANAVVFTLTINKRKDKTARGVFLVTLIIAVPLIIYKLFFL